LGFELRPSTRIANNNNKPQEPPTKFQVHREAPTQQVNWPTSQQRKTTTNNPFSRQLFAYRSVIRQRYTRNHAQFSTISSQDKTTRGARNVLGGRDAIGVRDCRGLNGGINERELRGEGKPFRRWQDRKIQSSFSWALARKSRPRLLEFFFQFQLQFQLQPRGSRHGGCRRKPTSQRKQYRQQ